MHRIKNAIPLFFLFFFTSCYKLEIPQPETIITIINGERTTVEKGTGNFNFAMQNISKTFSFSFVIKRNEKYTMEQIQAFFNSSLDAYKLRYSALTKMKIHRPGGYTETVHFSNIYIIKKHEARYVFFYNSTRDYHYPYMPITDVRTSLDR